MNTKLWNSTTVQLATFNCRLPNEATTARSLFLLWMTGLVVFVVCEVDLRCPEWAPACARWWRCSMAGGAGVRSRRRRKTGRRTRQPEEGHLALPPSPQHCACLPARERDAAIDTRHRVHSIGILASRAWWPKRITLPWGPKMTTFGTNMPKKYSIKNASIYKLLSS